MGKKGVLVVGIVVAVAVVIGLILMTQKNGSNKQGTVSTADSSSANNTDNANLGNKDACAYLTAKTANALLGSGATKGTNPANASTADLSVSTCTYIEKTTDDIASIQNARSATVLLRAPLTKVGEGSNRQPFDNRKNGAVDVQGYGEAAYWDPEMGQLNILAKDAWFIMSFGKVRAEDRTLEQTKELADQIIPNY